ncbi:hypothetical protein U1Q18_014515 [Sarracenia purpurea var. burkii]
MEVLANRIQYHKGLSPVFNTEKKAGTTIGKVSECKAVPTKKRGIEVGSLLSPLDMKTGVEEVIGKVDEGEISDVGDKGLSSRAATEVPGVDLNGNSSGKGDSRRDEDTVLDINEEAAVVEDGLSLNRVDASPPLSQVCSGISKNDLILDSESAMSTEHVLNFVGCESGEVFSGPAIPKVAILDAHEGALKVFDKRSKRVSVLPKVANRLAEGSKQYLEAGCDAQEDVGAMTKLK